jgi:hypothetical protein
MTSSSDKPEDKDGQIGAPERRAGERLPLILQAQCLVGYDRSSDVWLIDVSPSGCQLFACAGLLESGQEVVIHRNGDERHCGQVVWASGMKAGVRFDPAIPEDLLEQLLTGQPNPLAEPAPDSAKLVDRFGRELAPLPVLTKRSNRP